MSSDFATADTLVIALDIGKNVHWLGCYDGRLNVLVEPHKLRSNLDGSRQMTATVDPLLTGGRFRQAILGHEFTGIYHEPWSWHIHEHYAPHLSPQAACPLVYHQLNPLLTKKRRENNSIRRRSTDRLAVWAVAACLADGLGHPAHRLTPVEAQLGQLIRTYYQLQGQQQHLARQLTPQVDRLWPGAIVDVKKFCAAHPELEPPTPIVRTSALDRERVAALLLHVPNPYDALALGADGLQALLRREVGRAGPKTVDAILSMLRQAPLPPPAIAAIYAQRLRADFQAYVLLGDRIASLVTHIETLALDSDARFLDSVPGISPLLAARYLTAIIAAPVLVAQVQVSPASLPPLTSGPLPATTWSPMNPATPNAWARSPSAVPPPSATLSTRSATTPPDTARLSAAPSSMPASGSSTRLSPSSMPPTKLTVSALPSCVTDVPTGLSLPRSKLDSIVAGRRSTRRAGVAADRNRSRPSLA